MVGFTIRAYAHRTPLPKDGNSCAYDCRVQPLLESVVRCPVCNGFLSASSGATGGTAQAPAFPRLLACTAGHRYDAAKQGYFNLLTGGGTAFEADTPTMVQARMDFLSRGHYAPLAWAVNAAATTGAAHRPVILDAGAGTGYYLQSVRKVLPESEAIALDISKFALRRAVRALPGALCLVWDVWRALPIADASVDVLLNIFAPRNPAEFGRVVSDNGILVVVTPLPHHLREVAAEAGLLNIRAGKSDDVASSLAGNFRELSSTRLEFPMKLSAKDIADVAAMGPAGHHQPSGPAEPLPQGATVTAAFTIQTFLRLPRTAD